MGKALLIFGNNNLAALMVRYVQKYTDYEFCGFTVDKEYLKSDTFEGYPNIAFESIKEKYALCDVEILICIGNNKMNDIRKAKFEDIKKAGYTVAQFVHPSVNLETVTMGEGNILLENVSLGMGVQVGNCNIFWNGCNISHDCVVGDYNYIAPSAVMAGRVNIGNNCFIGVGSTIRNRVDVADYTFVGGGCYLNNSTQQGDVYVPARSVKLDKKSREMPVA